MSIYETKTGWKIKVMRNGYDFRDFVKGLDLKSQALAIEAQAVADMARGLKPVSGQLRHGTSLTLQLAYNETFASKWDWRSQGYRDKIKQYKKALDVFFIDECKVKRFEDIDTLLIDKFIQHLRLKGNGPKTINNKLTCLSTILKYMTHTGRLKHCPLIEWEKVGDNSRLRFYNQMEEDMLLELARTFYFTDNYRVRTEPVNHLMHDFIILLFDTGMRPWCEAHNIRGSWLTYDDEGLPLIRIPKAFTKTKKSRDIPMTGRVFRMLEKRCKGQDPDFRLFSKLMYKWHIGRFWNEVVRPTMGWGPDEVWYGMRHTFATRLVEVGTDIRVVQALLGHRNITQTARYAKVTNVILQNSIAALDSFGIKHQRPIQIEDNREDKHLPNNNPNEGQLHIHG